MASDNELNSVSLPKPRRMDPIAKRRAVLDAAEALFVGNGYDRTTIADIAAAADVAVGTVYRLYVDKPALLVALHQRMEDRFIAATLGGWSRGSDHPSRFAAMFAAIFAEAAASRAVMPLYGLTKEMLGAGGYRPGAALVATIAGLYAEGQAAGGLRPGAPGLMAAIAHGMTDAALRHWLAGDVTAAPDAHIGALTGLALSAFVV